MENKTCNSQTAYQITSKVNFFFEKNEKKKLQITSVGTLNSSLWINSTLPKGGEPWICLILLKEAKVLSWYIIESSNYENLKSWDLPGNSPFRLLWPNSWSWACWFICSFCKFSYQWVTSALRSATWSLGYISIVIWNMRCNQFKNITRTDIWTG